MSLEEERSLLEVAPDHRVSVTNLRASPLWTVNNHLARTRGDESREDIHLIPMSDAAPDVRELRMKAIRNDLGPEVTVDE